MPAHHSIVFAHILLQSACLAPGCCFDWEVVLETDCEFLCREGCASFASQQQYQSFVGGLCAMSDMTTHATDNGPSNRRPVLRRKRV